MRRSVQLLVFALALCAVHVGVQASVPTFGGSGDSQPSTKNNGWNLTWHGIIGPHLYADTRSVVGGREEMMLFYPLPRAYDSLGEDINAVPSMDLLAITARLSLTVNGPDVLGAKVLGYIEGDFTGSTNATNNNLRLRHAYVSMAWQHHSLLMGQYWHPLVEHVIMPNTRPLNMGAPFHPYARFNQLRYTFAPNSRWEMAAVAAFQLDNASPGPNGSSTLYQRRSMLPELYAGVRFHNGTTMLGAGVNCLALRPLVSYTNSAGMLVSSSSRLFSLSATFYLKQAIGEDWQVSGQYLYANNLSHVASMGGYRVYMPIMIAEPLFDNEAWSLLWVDFGRCTGKWRPGVLLAYGLNHSYFGGSSIFHAMYTPTFYGRGNDMEDLWRVQPRLGFHASSNMNFYVELEYTFAQYGKAAATSSFYKHDANGGVGNLRSMFSVEYRF